MESVVYKALMYCLFCLPFGLQAQLENPPLERTVTISLPGVSSQESLKLLEEQCACSFAYQTNLVPSTNHINRSYENKRVREILDDLFQLELDYKQKGNYVLLRPGKPIGDAETILSGYVYDQETREKIPYVSVYDTLSFTSTITDAFGHYTLLFDEQPGGKLEVRKQGYRDTSIVWTQDMHPILEIPLQRITAPIAPDTTAKERSKMFRLNERQKAQLNNFSDKFKGKAQFSILPWIGTNGALGPVTTVDYSLNAFGGFNHSVRKFEAGTLFNLNWDTVQYVQLAGFVNITGGFQRGAQLAGFVNLNGDSFKGYQAAGFTSITRKDFTGVQANGFVSTTIGSFTGLQAAGFVNYAGTGKKLLQTAGFANVVLQSMRGMQAAGFINYAGDSSKGVQLAGYINIAAKNFHGTQISGGVNVAKKMKGYQIGFININDTIDGVPFGFFSYSHKGLHQLEVSTNEVCYANLAFRTGTNQFYNIFSVGSRFEKEIWSVGYGIGTSVRLNDRNRIFFDLHSSGLAQGTAFNETASLHRLIVNYQHAFSKKFALAVGPSYNVLVLEHSNSLLNTDLYNVAPYSFYDQQSGSTSIRMWVGGTLALRFF